MALNLPKTVKMMLGGPPLPVRRVHRIPPHQFRDTMCNIEILFPDLL